MAETTLQGIWTQKGLDKETAFRAGGERKKLTHVAVGDGNGSLPIVSAAQTSLVHEVWRGLANAVMVNPDDPTDLLVDAVIPNSVGGFWIREWGIFDEDGDLVAVGPHDEMHKPLISTGQAAEFLERFHLPSANATFVEIKIASQALATQQYVEREIDAHDKDGGSHETLARKNVQIKAGTGLSGGGTLEADRTLVVTYGNAAGTACQGNDVRLSDPRTPKAHKDSHKTGGTDALAPGDIGAAPASHISVAATTTVLGHVKFGAAAGTACQGNDARLSDARTPKAHKATHKTGGADALLPEEIGAARGNRISATTPATAGWYRLAQSAASISNCMGLFEITGAVSGAHSVSLIAAGISFGKAPGLIQLAHAPFSAPAVTKARLVYHPTYSGNFAYLEVYLSQAKATPLSVNLLGGQGWSLVAPSTAGAVPSGYSTKELTLAEGKIVGDVIGSLTGNAATSTKLATPRTIALSGDATASGTFDGSGNLTLAATLKNSGATAGSYGPGANATPAFGASFEVPEVTVDAKGRVTSIAERTVKLPAAPASVTGNAGTATKLATARTIDGVSFNGSTNITHYGACATEAATAEKAVACTGFLLATGSRITVRFTATNSAASPTLNVNGTGAKAIRYRNAAISAGYLAANRTYDFVYDGSCYQLVGDLDTNTTYAAAAAAPKAPGTAAVGTSVKYAREDHVHPVQTTVSGNAGTATKLLTARTIALAGDVTASGSFDGSGNLTLTAALKNSGATAGAYGPGANATPAFNGTFSVPQITVDAKGRVTAAATRTVKIPANPAMTGSTASAAGKAGLVPAPAAGAQDLFLTGGAVYKAALTKITDSVNSAASDTAASAKAVKSAYDRGSAGITAAEKKLPLSGGTMSGAIAAAASLSKVLCGSTAAQRLHYCGGTSTLDGGHFVVEGKDGSVNPGGFEAVATDGSVRHSLIGRLDGLLAWDGKAIELVASKVIGEQNGCIQFASGLQICWGVVGNKSTVTFRRAFKSVPIVVITHIMASTNGVAVPIGSYPTTTTLYCRDGTNETTYGNGYIAIGEGA